MRGLEEATKKLNCGHLAVFIKADGQKQLFRVLNGALHEYKDDMWKERTYLPRWDDLKTGRWIF